MVLEKVNMQKNEVGPLANNIQKLTQDSAFNFFYFGYIPRSGIAGSCDNSIFFHSSYTIIHSHQQCTRVTIPPLPKLFSLFLSFFLFFFLLSFVPSSLPPFLSLSLSFFLSFYSNNPNESETVSHCGFDLHFPNN